MGRLMRAYRVDDRRVRGRLLVPGGYLVPASPMALQRPNKAAAGASVTLQRRYGRTVVEKPSDALTRLSVKGTFDVLARFGLDKVRKPCPCCGQSDPKRIGLRPGTAKALERDIKRRHPVRPLP